ncbi:CBS domain-containing protein [Neobacillus sp. PS3-12]|jgi:CBS domain-containing protein|uniref:CBS domain-containing protein n=1 Tax=Neobacillus sp. PS3-12 TaxID=3070677 RepID=UPI0027E1AB30|nr:CBS domain-containing protein [Neobacillus sp. PS3-12]WML52850.1 CBS domain-containing protein [Neobacillus sp. PS3-12]
MKMKVKDFMIKDVISVRPDATIKEVMKTFVDKKIGGLPIVNDEGILKGIITDGDILRAIKPIDRHIQDYFNLITYIEEQNMESRLSELAELPILRIAKTRGIVTVSPEDDMKQVVVILAKHHFKKLPVIDKGNKVVGVISRGDVIRNIQNTIINELELS